MPSVTPRPTPGTPPDPPLSEDEVPSGVILSGTLLINMPKDANHDDFDDFEAVTDKEPVTQEAASSSTSGRMTTSVTTTTVMLLPSEAGMAEALTMEDNHEKRVLMALRLRDHVMMCDRCY